MRKFNTDQKPMRLSGAAASLLRSDLGSGARIARQLGVNRSTVSRVVNGKKTSQRVRVAVINECLRIAKLHADAAAIIEIAEAALEHETTQR